MGRLDETLESVGYDNLIAGVYPPTEVFSVKLKAGQGVLERGSLLAVGANGMELISATTTGKANAVLAEPVDTGEPVAQDGEGIGTEEEGDAGTVMAVAYRTGHFNPNVLIVADGYEITAEDKEALRIAGILLSDAVEN
ncbi:MAG: head decoration protein [Enterocloster citroniae]|nr:head decoration protein [Enterocloster citroniae]DAG76398.1 MAG TPA: Head decoration protein, Viral protein.5A [Caudoviricetes sp.]DAW25431.1 MAG TPA: Head decoration protein, Viral protein.5A [Caudoviricetes sp.]